MTGQSTRTLASRTNHRCLQNGRVIASVNTSWSYYVVLFFFVHVRIIAHMHTTCTGKEKCIILMTVANIHDQLHYKLNSSVHGIYSIHYFSYLQHERSVITPAFFDKNTQTCQWTCEYCTYSNMNSIIEILTKLLMKSWALQYDCILLKLKTEAIISTAV